MITRTLSDRVFDLREWQSEAFRSVMAAVDEGKKDFLCVATPGSGKTKFGLRVAYEFFRKKLCNRVIVVTPTEGLKRQWAAAAAEFAGVDIDPDFKNDMGIEAPDFHGAAITYALIGQDKKGVHKQNTFNHRTFVILDEPHHMGESLTWGEASKQAFENAVFRLCISGTAFRSDDNPIPFITYDDNNTSIADYTYSYSRAIQENICRPVYFSMFDGTMKWRVGTEEFEHSFEDYLTPDQVSKRLKTALDPKGNWIRGVIAAADTKLNEIRKTHPDAAALVFAATQRHARDIAKVIEEITGEMPPIVVSSDGNGSEKIEQFRTNNSRWLVSVKMVSEGVDIPRLRIGVYLTIVKAELFFRQAVGRFVRVLKDLHWQDAFMFIPQDKEVVKLAETIQEERDHALDEAERKSKSDAESDNLFGSDYTPALRGKFTPLSSEVTDEEVMAVNVNISNGAKHSIDKRKPAGFDPLFLQKERMRDRLNSIAKKIALKRRNGNTSIKPDWKFAHKAWIESGGKEMEHETIEELERREKFYLNLLR